jgi:hypothetical protein
VANPSELTPSAVGIPAPELRAGIVHEDATAPGQKIKCILPNFGKQWTSDPLKWSPFVTPAGFFYPKHGNEAVVAYPPDAPPYIAEWWPADDTSPDVPL